LSQAQQLIDEYQMDLELVQKAWGKTQTKLRESHEIWEKSQQEIQNLARILASHREQSLLLRAELERRDRQKEHLQEVIEAMKTSKFWQLRQKWFKIKANLGLQLDPEIPST
jgi:predicted transposase YdaD